MNKVQKNLDDQLDNSFKNRDEDELLKPPEETEDDGLPVLSKKEIDAIISGNDKRSSTVSNQTEDIPMLPVMDSEVGSIMFDIGKSAQLEAAISQEISSEGHFVLEGTENTGLEAAMKQFKTKSGDIIVAGTDKGIGYKDINEDRVLIDLDHSVFAVVDGMGGAENGWMAADFIAHGIIDFPADIEKGVKQAQENMRKTGMSYDSGACFLGIRIQETSLGKVLNYWQAGDVKLAVFDKSGKLKFESVDQSYVQTLVDKGILTREQSYRSPLKSLVGNAIGPSIGYATPGSEAVLLESGDRVLLASDGISDNLTMQEIGELIRENLIDKGLRTNVFDLFRLIANIIEARMANFSVSKRKSPKIENKGLSHKVFDDNFLQPAKCDNASLMIIDIA